MTIIVCDDTCIAHGECWLCGGSASLGGTQEELRTPDGIFCSTDCHDEFIEFAARAKAAAKTSWCLVCGFDNHEHNVGCPETWR